MTSALEVNCPPLYGTRRSPDRPTLGPQVSRLAESLGKPPLPHQRLIYDVAFEIDPATGMLAYDEVTVIGPRQVTGKALDVDTPLWTHRGWVPMGQARAGDKVAHPDGHFTDILFTSEVMHDRTCYRVTTLDGRQVIADADHLWRVYDTFTGTRVWRTLTTAQIAATGLRNRGNPGGWRYRLPIQQAVKTPDVDLPIDPYLFGVWLGDGTSANSSLTVGSEDLAHMTSSVVAAGCRVKSAKQDPRTGAWALWVSALEGPAMNALLRELGVIRNKHVPELYLSAGYGQRLALLQGLMDTDGCITENHGSSPRCEFTSTNRALAEAVLFLARSLGWRPSLLEGRATLNGRDCGPKWRVAFTATLDDPRPFRLARKASRVRAAMPRTGKRTAVSIVSIEPVESRPVRCIKVASPDGLFLAGRDLVATHNTELMLPAMTYRCVAFDEALVRWIRKELGKTVPLPGPQRVLYTAQTADNAREKWRDVHVNRLKRSPIRSQVETRLRLNAEQIAFPNGSTWSPGSTTGKTAGTGDTLDMPVIDEAWSQQTNRTELGLRPAMLTRPWRQLWALSMIPGISRALPGSWPYLWSKRQNGRARVEADIRSRVAYFEWAAAKGSDPADPATWFSCMPALGHHVPLSSVQSDYDSMAGAGNLTDFTAEYLGWPPEANAARWATISEQTWKSLQLPRIDGIPYGDPVAFGVEAQPEQVSASIGMSARTPDGHTFVELVEQRPGLNWTIDVLAELIRKFCPCAVGIAAHGPAAPIIEPLRRKLRDDNLDTEIVVLQGPEVTKACGQFYTETGEVGDHAEDTGRRIRHLGQRELDQSVADSIKYRYADQWRFQRSGEAGDASPLYSVVLARAAGEAVEWLGGSYDIGDSLG